jgi:hypothetical protein
MARFACVVRLLDVFSPLNWTIPSDPAQQPSPFPRNTPMRRDDGYRETADPPTQQKPGKPSYGGTKRKK